MPIPIGNAAFNDQDGQCYLLRLYLQWHGATSPMKQLKIYCRCTQQRATSFLLEEILPHQYLTLSKSSGKSRAQKSLCRSACLPLGLRRKVEPTQVSVLAWREADLWRSRMRAPKRRHSEKTAAFPPWMRLDSKISTQYLRLKTCRPGPVIEIILGWKQNPNHKLHVYLKKQITVIVQSSWQELPTGVQLQKPLKNKYCKMFPWSLSLSALSAELSD